MKRAVIGGFLTLVGSIWMMAALMAGGACMEQVTSWYTPPGRYGTALMESGMVVPLLIGSVLLILGLVAMGVEFFKREGR